MFFDTTATYCFLRDRQRRIQRRQPSHHLQNIPAQADPLPAAWTHTGSRCTQDNLILVGDDDGGLGLLEIAPFTTHTEWHVRAQGNWLSLDISEDARRVIALDDTGHLFVFDMITRQVFKQQREGMISATARISATGQTMAMSMSHRKGGDVRLWHLHDGRVQLHTRALDRRHIQGPTARLHRPSTLVMAITDEHLAIYESVAPWDDAPVGWRGCVHVYDVQTGGLLWSAIIDAHITGDRQPLEDVVMSAQYGCPGALWFDHHSQSLYCGTARGVVLDMDRRDGALQKTYTLPTTMPIVGLAGDLNGTLWALTFNEHLFHVCQSTGKS